MGEGELSETMRCKELETELSSFLDGELADAERREVEGHLAECPACSAIIEEQRQLKLAVRGHLLKTAYYRKYQPQLGTERPTETVIIDGLEPDWVTVMRFSSWKRRPARRTIAGLGRADQPKAHRLPDRSVLLSPFCLLTY